MKLRMINYISALCFFLSSAALLFIPLLDYEGELSIIEYCVAGAFWILLLLGIVLQLILQIKTRDLKVHRQLRVPGRIIQVVLLISIAMLFVVLTFLRTNVVALPINLFVLFISVESLGVIHRMEKLL